IALAVSGCGNFFTKRTDNPSGSTSSKFAYVANFNNGGAGSISPFTLDTATGALTANGSPVSTSVSSGTGGDGPTSLAIVLGKFLYSVNDGAGVSGFSIKSDGTLIAVNGSPFRSGGNGSSIVGTPNGKFVYAASTANNEI